MGLRDAIHDRQRFPRGQDVVSYGRVVKWARESAGKRDGTSGTKMGQAALQWAFSDAAGLLWRTHPAGQTDLARLEKNHGNGQAVPSLAHTLARAVYAMLQRHTAVAMATFLRGYGRAAGEP